MPTNINVSNITGQEPFDVYICDSGSTVCVYVDTINSVDLPYIFNVPLVFEGLTSFNLQVVDDNNCIINQIINI